MNTNNVSGAIRISFAACLLLAFISVCTGAFGAEFSLKPAIALRQAYDDNVFLTRDNRMGDYISHVLPSAAVEYRSHFLDLSADYTFHWWYYWRRHVDDNSHLLDLTSRMNVIDNFLYIDTTDAYTNTVVNTRRPSTETNLEINRTDTNTLTTSPYIKYRVTPITEVSLGYRYSNIWYRREGIGRNIHTGFTKIEYDFSPKLKGSAGADYTADRPGAGGDSNDRTSGFLGIAYTPNPNTKIEATAGYRRVHFSSLRDRDRFFYDASLTNQFHEKGQIELRAASELTTSPQGLVETRSEQATVRYGETFLTTGSVFHRKEQYYEKVREDEVFGATAGIEYKSSPRLTLRAGARYEKRKFSPFDERHDVYGASAGMDYLLTAKTTFSLGYNFANSHSTNDIDSYYDNLVWVQVRAYF